MTAAVRAEMSKHEQFPQADSITGELIEQYVAYREQLDAIQESMKEIQGLLAEAAREEGSEGLRWRQLAVYCSTSTRRTLSRELLLENGCPPEVIARSFQESKPFATVRVVDLATR